MDRLGASRFLQPNVQLTGLRTCRKENCAGRTRLKYSLSVLILMLFLVSCASAEIQPTLPTAAATPGITMISPTSAPTPTFLKPSPTPPTGLGVSRSDAAHSFELLKFTFALKTDAYGKDVYVGTLPDKFAQVQLFGPPLELNQAVLVMWVQQPISLERSKRVDSYLASMLSTFASDWDEGLVWLDENRSRTGQSKIQIGDKEAILNQTPSKNMMTIEFTIRLKPHE